MYLCKLQYKQYSNSHDTMKWMKQEISVMLQNSADVGMVMFINIQVENRVVQFENDSYKFITNVHIHLLISNNDLFKRNNL